jgi:integrase
MVMVRIEHLSKCSRTQNWQYRRAIPAALRRHWPDGPRTEILRSWGSKTVTPAVQAAHARYAAEVAAKFQIARRRLEGAYDPLDAARIASLLGRHRHNVLSADEAARFNEDDNETLALSVASNISANFTKTPEGIKAHRHAQRQESLAAYVAGLRRDLATGTISAFIQEEAGYLLEAAGLHVDTQSLDYRRYCRAFLTAEIELTEAQLERQRGEVINTPPPPAETPTVQRAAASRLSEVIQLRMACTRDPMSASERKALSTASRYFININGDIAFASISRATAAYHVSKLQKIPARKSHVERSMLPTALIDRYRDNPTAPRLNPKTINNGHLSSLRPLWHWAWKEGLLPDRNTSDNPFSNQNVTDTRTRAARAAPQTDYTAEQLAAIFSLPIFTAGERPAGCHGEAGFWLPLLACFTGARREELAQLMTDDIKLDASSQRWCIHITDAGAHPTGGRRSLKTSDSLRTIPVPQTLIDLGFIRYHQNMVAAGEAALFPRLRPHTSKGRICLAQRVGEWWSRYLRAAGIDAPQNKPFHAFRHTWKTYARTAGIPEEERNYLSGHRHANAVAAGYGSHDIATLAAHIDKINFPALILSSIGWAES